MSADDSRKNFSETQPKRLALAINKGKFVVSRNIIVMQIADLRFTSRPQIFPREVRVIAVAACGHLQSANIQREAEFLLLSRVLFSPSVINFLFTTAKLFFRRSGNVSIVLRKMCPKSVWREKRALELERKPSIKSFASFSLVMLLQG